MTPPRATLAPMMGASRAMTGAFLVRADSSKAAARL
jgi:hypothetical protein